MKQIIEETKESLLDYIPRLIDAATSMAENLQSGNHYEAMHQLPLFFEGIDWTLQAIVGIQNNGYPIEIDSTLLNNFLGEVATAMQNQDFILLADLLEYEFTPIFETWLDEVAKLTGGKNEVENS